MFEDFEKVGKKLAEEGLVNYCGGSLSIRQDNSIFITRRDADLGNLKKEDIIEVPLETEEKNEAASLELYTHRAIYKTSSHKAIVNARPKKAIVLSMTENKIIPLDSEGSFLLRAVPIVRVKEAIGGTETAKFITPIFSSNYVVSMVKGHGSFAVGHSLLQAYKFTSCLEHTCEIILDYKVLSSVQKPISEERGMRPQQSQHRGAIPPGLGVMDRSRSRTNFTRGRLPMKRDINR